MEWVLSHLEDADFNDPLPPPAVAAPAAPGIPLVHQAEQMIKCQVVQVIELKAVDSMKKLETELLTTKCADTVVMLPWC